MKTSKNKRIRWCAAVLAILLLAGCSEKPDPSESAAEEQVLPDTTESSIAETVLEEVKSYAPSEELTNDIRSFRLQIDDSVYAFPLTYREFTATGWEINQKYASADEELQSRAYELVWFTRGDVGVVCYMYNPDISVQTYENCLVAGVKADIRFEAKDAAVFIPGGLHLGVATSGDVAAAFEDPDRHQETSDTTMLYEYSTDNNWSYIKLWFENDVLVSYEAQNLITPDGFIYSEPVDIQIEYQAPTALGNSIEDRIVSFDGDLYKLPAPLSAFIDNGWTTESLDEVVPADYFTGLELKRNDVSFVVSVYNFSDQACTAADAFVKDLSSNDIYRREFLLSGGITLDLTMDELESILVNGGYTYSVKEGTSYTTYTIKLSGVAWYDYCEISFDNDSGSMAYISVSSSAP